MSAPFWAHGCEQGLEFDQGARSVKFHAHLVVPDGQDPPPPDAKLPLLVYFAGLGSHGGLKELKMEKFAQCAPTAFVLAAPFRDKGRWWFLDSDSEPWGFVDGNYLPEAVDSILSWITHLTEDATIDPDWVSLMGFSAGAYAVTELVARNRHFNLHGVLMGGVHGHCQSDFSNYDVKRKKGPTPEAIEDKWRTYIERILSLSESPRIMLGIHHPEDEMCPWVHAEKIYLAFNKTRRDAGLQGVEVDLVTGLQRSKKNKTLHNYHDKAIYRASFLRRLLPIADVGKRRAHSEEDWMFTPARLPGRFEIEDLLSLRHEDSGTADLPVAKPDFREIMRSTIGKGIAEASEKAPRGGHQTQGQSSSSSTSTRRALANQHSALPDPIHGSPNRGHPAKRQRMEPAPPWAREDSHRRSHAGPGREGYVRHPPPPPARSETSGTRQRYAAPAQPQPEQHVSRRRASGRIDRSQLICAAENCSFLVHVQPEFGGFCCRKCHWRFDVGSKCKKKHGELCAQAEAPPTATKAEPIPPDDPGQF